MTFGGAISDGFSKYATFSGRSSRSAFWWWILFSFLGFIVAAMIDGAIGVKVVARLTILALLIPSLAVLVRRLHDVGRSGWWVLIWLVPLVGPIILIVFTCTASEPPNKYGDGGDGKGSMTSHHGQTLSPPPPPMPQSPPNEMPPPAASDRASD